MHLNAIQDCCAFLRKKIGRFWHYNNALRKRRKSLLIPFLNDPISIFITFLILLLVTLSRSWINNWFENQVIRIFLSFFLHKFNILKSLTQAWKITLEKFIDGCRESFSCLFWTNWIMKFRIDPSSMFWKKEFLKSVFLLIISLACFWKRR